MMTFGLPGRGRRARAGWVAALALVTAVLLLTLPVSSADTRGCPGAAQRASETTVAELADAIVCLINAERREDDLRRLAVDRRLTLAGWRHAADMRDHGYFSHRSRDGRGFADRIEQARYLEGHEGEPWTVGETLAWGRDRDSAAIEIVDALMDSAAHRRVLLDDAYREVGVGLVRGTPTEHADGVTVAIDVGSLAPSD
jgi:uncharacterized protein YkwD